MTMQSLRARILEVNRLLDTTDMLVLDRIKLLTERGLLSRDISVMARSLREINDLLYDVVDIVEKKDSFGR